MSDELKNISPILSELKENKIGFKTPDAYFSNLDNQILTQTALVKQSQKTGFKVPDSYFENAEAAIHLKSKKQNNFKVPTNYFENFEVKSAEIKSKNKSSLFTLNRFWIPVAIAAVFVLSIGINNLQSLNANVQVADMENWIENGALNLSSYDLASIYEPELENINLTDFVAKEEIEDYLGNDINEMIYYD